MNSTLHFLGLDIEQEMMSRFIFMMKMELEPDQLFEQVVIGQDFSDSGGKNCSIVMTKRCILKMREESVFIKICFQELRQCYDTVEEYMGEPVDNEVQVAGEVASKSDVKFPLEQNHEIFLKLKRDNKEIKQGIYRLMQHFPVDQQLKSLKREMIRKYSYLEGRLNKAESEIKDLRREVESLRSKKAREETLEEKPNRKPFHHDSRRLEKEGICDRTSSGEVL